MKLNTLTHFILVKNMDQKSKGTLQDLSHRLKVEKKVKCLGVWLMNKNAMLFQNDCENMKCGYSRLTEMEKNELIPDE